MEPASKHGQLATILLLGSLRQNIQHAIAGFGNRGRCMITHSYGLRRSIAQIRRHMSGIDGEAVDVVFLGIDAAGVPIEHRFSRGVRRVGDGEMVPTRFISIEHGKKERKKGDRETRTPKAQP